MNNSIRDIISEYKMVNILNNIKFVSISELRQSDISDEIIYINDLGKEGFFRYNSFDDDTNDDGAMCLITKSKLRYHRIYDHIVNVNWFGALANCNEKGKGEDNTIAVQNAIQFLDSNGGGTLFFPASKNYYKISSIYTMSNITIYGESFGMSQNTNAARGTKVYVTDQGFIVGYDSFDERKRSSQVTLKNLSIIGSPEARCGIRIGSDISYISPVGIEISNIFLFDFRNDKIRQLVYNKSSRSLGKFDENLPACREVIGACGIFISGVVTLSINRVMTKNCVYGIYESAGTLCTTISVKQCQFTESLRDGVVLTSANGVSFSDQTVFESNMECGLKLICEKSSIQKLKEGPSNVSVENCWFESNCARSYLNNGFAIHVENENVGKNIYNFSIINSKLQTGHHSGNLIKIFGGQYCKILNNDPNLRNSETLLYSRNSDSVIFEGLVQGNIDTDNKTILKPRGVNSIYDHSGGLGYDYRQADTGNTLDEVVIMGGRADFALLNDIVKKSGDIVSFKMEGMFKNNDNIKTIYVYLNEKLIATNYRNRKPRNSFSIELKFLCNTYPSDCILHCKIFCDGQPEDIVFSVISEAGFWQKINKIKITAKNSVFNSNDITGLFWYANFLGFYKKN